MKKFLLSAAMAVVALGVSAQDYYLVGASIENWANPSSAAFVAQGDGVYTVTVENLTGQFQITNGTWDPDCHWGCKEDAPLEPGVEYEMAVNGGNVAYIETVKEVNNATVTLRVTEEAKYITVTGDVVTQVAPAYVDLYVMGSITSWEFVDAQKMTFDEEAGEYTYELTVADNAYLETAGEYKIAGNGWAPNYGANEDTLPLNDNNMETVLVKGDNPGNAVFGLGEGIYTIYAVMSDDKKTLEVAIEPAGVSVITDDNADVPAVYYNLQGVQVNAPANGLYIVKQGNKVSKVLVK